jgi:hypothetical protein
LGTLQIGQAAARRIQRFTRPKEVLFHRHCHSGHRTPRSFQVEEASLPQLVPHDSHRRRRDVSVQRLTDFDHAGHDTLGLPASFEYIFRLIAEERRQVGIHSV